MHVQKVTRASRYGIGEQGTGPAISNSFGLDSDSDSDDTSHGGFGEQASA